ncbi:MAG: carbohydrate-binding domain-containing protein [Lachnospira sp.]|nr:carbohydrate-binding domain-containing protein [Lachnospira sp.]
MKKIKIIGICILIILIMVFAVCCVKTLMDDEQTTVNTEKSASENYADNHQGVSIPTSGNQQGTSGSSNNNQQGTSSSTNNEQQTTTMDNSAIEPTTAQDANDNYQEPTGDFFITTEVNNGYYLSNNIYTITKAGDYICKGTLSEGYICVDAAEQKVKIVLNGVSVTSTTNSVIYVKAADSVTVSSEEGSYNVLTDARALQTSEEDISGSACIYAESDLKLAGKGNLVIKAGYNNGIHTKDDLEIKNVTLKVSAPNNAIKGNDSITINSGNVIAISTGGDGLKTTNSDISDKGNQRGTISILGGNVDIYAACDGIDAAYNVEISKEASPNINIYTGNYSNYSSDVVETASSEMYIRVSGFTYYNNYRYAAYFYNDAGAGEWVNATYHSMQTGGGMGRPGSSRNTYYYYKLSKPANYNNIKIYCFAKSQVDNSDTTYYAVSEGGTINVAKDMYVISSMSSSKITGDWSTYTTGNSSNGSGTTYSTKGIKADNEILISGGTITIKCDDDGVHANGGITLENGASSTGIVNISGGKLEITAADDGIHSDTNLIIGGGYINVLNSYEGLEANVLTFNGGTVYVVAKDDGINATTGSKTPAVQVNGGYIDVTVGSGDTDGIDSNGSYTQTGGIVISKCPNNNQNAASLDMEGTFTVTGGTIICTGGLYKSFSSASTNNYVTFGSSSSGGGMGRPGSSSSSGSGVTFSAGTYTLSGTDISFKLGSSYTNMWISSDKFVVGSSYTLSNGTTSKTWTQSSKATNVN